jgi:hypothetical protein
MDGVGVSRAAVNWWATKFDGHSFMAIGESDPVLAATMPAVHERINGCPPPLVLAEAGHFVQEWGDAVARAAIAEWSG